MIKDLIICISLLVLYIMYRYVLKRKEENKYYFLGIFVYVFLLIYYFVLADFKVNFYIPRIFILLVLHITLFKKIYKKLNQLSKPLKMMFILMIAIIVYLSLIILPEQHFIKFSNPVDLFNYSIVEKNDNIINVVYPDENSAFVVSNADVVYLEKINNKWLYENTLYRNNKLVKFYNYPNNCNLRILETKDNTRLLEITTLIKDMSVTDEFNSSFKVVDFGNSARYYIVLDSQLQNYNLIIDNKTYKILKNGGIIELYNLESVN